MGAKEYGLGKNITKSRRIFFFQYFPSFQIFSTAFISIFFFIIQSLFIEVDMWSVGCILAELVTLKPIFLSDGSQID